ncbi:MAG: Uma2 family endonuclease [Armatimonadaceae bacterium]
MAILIRSIGDLVETRAVNTGNGDTVVIYPDSDGEPMAENDLQFEWITTLKWNLDDMLRDNPEVYVAGDMLWYPVEGHPEIRNAPDAFVVFGRPKGYRGSYKQFEENNVPLHVVFEVLSPGNRAGEMARKREFYERYGTEEYYVLSPDYIKQDPEQIELQIWQRSPDTGEFERILWDKEFVSPRLGVRFVREDGTVHVYRADGERFKTYLEVFALRREAEARAEAEAERARIADERANAAEAKLAQLAARLRELGIDPDTEG